MTEEVEPSPAESQLETIKAKFDDRIVTIARLGDDYGEYEFVLTSPTEPEWDRLQKELKEAGSDPAKQKSAMKSAVLAQIRYPERTEVQKTFAKRPAMATNLVPILGRLAGVDAEEREKKL